MCLSTGDIYFSPEPELRPAAYAAGKRMVNGKENTV
jgi:hypothetical protein